MKALKAFNSIEEIYKDGILEQEGLFQCSVCGKEFKTKTRATTHIENHSCHTHQQVFRGTVAEDAINRLYMLSLSLVEKHSRYNKKFIDSRNFNRVAEYYVFCLTNEVTDQHDYLAFVSTLSSSNNKWSHLQLFSTATKQSTLKRYFESKRKIISIEESTKFFLMNQDQFSDSNFTLRALEKGDVNYKFLFSQVDFDSFISKLTPIEVNRLSEFLSTVK